MKTNEFELTGKVETRKEFLTVGAACRLCSINLTCSSFERKRTFNNIWSLMRVVVVGEVVVVGVFSASAVLLRWDCKAAIRKYLYGQSSSCLASGCELSIA